MRNVLIVSCISILITSCTPVDESFDKNKIAETIQKKGDEIVKALNDADMETLSKDFWESDSTIFMIDGGMVSGHETITNIISGLPNQRKDIEITVNEERVYVLGEDAAMHILDFNERVTQNNDSITTNKGVWCTIYHKIDDEWKIVLVHESHAGKPTQGNMQ